MGGREQTGGEGKRWTETTHHTRSHLHGFAEVCCRVSATGGGGCPGEEASPLMTWKVLDVLGQQCGAALLHRSV